MDKIKIGIITDTASDLTLEMYRDNNIEIIPYYLSINGKEFESGNGITVSELFEISRQEKKLPKTTQITPNRFLTVFEEYLEKYEEIIYCGLGSGFSGTCNNAYLAGCEIDEDRIHIVDSCNLSGGIGVLLLKACKMRDNGASAIEIVNELNRCTPLVRSEFCVETLEFLHYGGRCSGTAKVFGTLLKIKPIIKVVENQMILAKKPIGPYKKALDLMLEDVKNDLDNIDTDNILITHCCAEEKDINYIKSEFSKILPEGSYKETFAGPIVSTHCGPRTTGIMYLLKK